MPYAFKISIINEDLYQNQKREEKIMETIKIKYFTDQIDKLEYIDGKSDWIDLRASENVSLKSGDFALIPLGVAMAFRRAMRRILSHAAAHTRILA